MKYFIISCGQLFLIALVNLAIPPSAAAAEKPLLLDPDFSAGYEVMSPKRDIYTDRSKREAIHSEKEHSEKSQKQKPVWRLVQWGSANSIAGVDAVALAGGGTTWTAEENRAGQPMVYKRVGTGLIAGTAEPGGKTRSLLLELNGLAEFSSAYYADKNRQKGKKNNYLTSSNEYWPHLLMVQNLATEKLSTYNTLTLSMDARLAFDDNNISEGYQQDLHAARFVVSMAVRDTLSNNGFWLNAVIYDSRYPSSGFLCQKCRSANSQDCYVPELLTDPGSWVCPFDGQRWSKGAEKKGTRRMIFRIPTTALTAENIHNGAWTHYQVDLLPYIKAGIDAARADKSLRGFHPSLEFYDLSLFSMGWEITGLNHAAMQLRNVDLSANSTAAQPNK